MTHAFDGWTGAELTDAITRIERTMTRRYLEITFSGWRICFAIVTVEHRLPLIVTSR